MRASIVQQGVIRCFPEGLEDSAGQPVNAEVSAVAFDRGQLLLASDKPIPGEGRSAVFTVPFNEQGPDDTQLRYLTAEPIVQTIKYEDFALSADGRYVLATTGFDRIHASSSELNHYNNLLMWPVEHPEQAHRVDSGGFEAGSLGLRDKLTAAIGTPYYKIEGLAAIPDHQPGADGLLLFGVREAGRDYADFDYVCRVVGAHYAIDGDGRLSFANDFRTLYSFDAEGFEGVRFDCGLSSLEYDPHNDRLFLLASFEVAGDQSAASDLIGGYLWVVGLDDFRAGQAPTLITDARGRALEFDHKAEGLAVLDARRLFVVYDNDREMRLGEILEREHRTANEALYTVLALD